MMRTTLTIDDDVAVRLETLRRAADTSFRTIVNEALREGLEALARARQPDRRPFRTRTFALGAKVDIANVAEALALAEGDDFK